LNLQPLFKAEITLAAAQELGDTPQGRRRIIGITGVAQPHRLRRHRRAACRCSGA